MEERRVTSRLAREDGPVAKASSYIAVVEGRARQGVQQGVCVYIRETEEECLEGTQGV
jgi:hypothetical protein